MPQWIPAVTALIAVVLGPLVSIYVVNRQIKASTSIAEKQITASVVSTNRREWIKEFRDLISEFISLISIESSPFQAEPSAKERRILIAEKIKLFLNPTEEDYPKLVELIFEVNAHASTLGLQTVLTESDPLYALLHEEIDKISDLSSSILKREWERVKQGD